MGEVNSWRFTFSRESRNRICADKDTAMRPIYDRLRVRYPARFRAILMPGMFGREAYFCRERDRERYPVGPVLLWAAGNAHGGCPAGHNEARGQHASVCLRET
jgi:hypothetical protein